MQTPKSLRKTFIKTETVKTVSSQLNLGISQTSHGVTEARDEWTVLTGFSFPSVNCLLVPWPRAPVLRVFPREWHSREEEVAIIAACH